MREAGHLAHPESPRPNINDKSLQMTNNDVQQIDIVRARTSESAEADPRPNKLHSRAEATTDEPDELDAFDLAEGQCQLSDRTWTDSLFSRPREEYL